MLTMYLCFLAGGAVMPIISVIFGAFGNGTDVDVDTDMDVSAGTDVEIGSAADAGTDLDFEAGTDTMFSLGLLPTSLMSLSALAITFGAVGGVMTYGNKGKIITFIIAAISGYIASVFVQTIIKTLKKAQQVSNVVDEKELVLYDGKVIDTILPGQLGSISFTTLKNVMVSYPAKCSDESLKLETGKIVRVQEIKNGIFIVVPKNKYE